MSRLLWLDTALILAVGSGAVPSALQQDPAPPRAAAPGQERGPRKGKVLELGDVGPGQQGDVRKPEAKRPAAKAPVTFRAEVKVAAPVRLQVVAGGVRFDPAGAPDGPSENVKLNESTNLDRYLTKAQEFLAKDDYDGVRTLQAVIEGRAVDPGTTVVEELDRPDLAVFGRDERLFVPVTSYCHQLLAALSEDALEAYRSEHDAEAGRMLQSAMEARDLDGVNEVIRRFFVSRHGDEALDYAGDLLMDRGRFRRAIQMWETIVDLYPRDADVSVKDVLTKAAFAYARLGERRKVAETLDRLRERSPDATVRIAGELASIDQLRTHPQFLAADDADHDPAAEPPPLPALAFHWLHRFDVNDPFAEEKKTNRNQHFRMQGSAQAIPKPAFFPGSSVTAVGDLLFVKEHDRLLELDLATGKLLWRSGGNPQPPRKRQGTYTSRNPLFDFAGMRVHHDATRLYVTEENVAATGGQQGLTFKNALAAYTRSSGRLAWSTEKQDGTPLKGTLFLAPPTPFEGRLYAPVLAKGWFAILCLDAETGDELWRLPISGGGTRFVRPPAAPLVIDDGAVFFLTNAGTVAAADTGDGRLRWIRKYELEDPRDFRRPARRPRAGAGMGFVPRQVTVEKVAGFAPTAPVAIDGKVIIAPSDGKALLCLDAATGELLWLLPKEAEGKFDYVVGHDGEHLFLAGTHVQCIHLRTGKRLWERAVMDQFAGRGFVTRDHVYLPGPDGSAEGILRLRNDGAGDIERVPLTIPPRDPPLQGPYDITLAGDHLILAAAGWVGVWSDFATWAARAADGSAAEAARILAQAGRAAEALDKYLAIARAAADPDERTGALRRAAVLAGEHAVALAKSGDARSAEEVLDRVLAEVSDREDRLRLMLDRIEARRSLGDAAGTNAAREALRDYLDRG
jgi:outer membrane protein assembly factor BamB